MKKALQWTRGERIAQWSVLAGVCVLAIVALVVTLVDSGPPELAAGSDLVLPIAKLKTNKLFLFRYHLDSSTVIPLAVQRVPDGTIRVAFGACRPCLKSGGYESSGKVMCGHCRHVMKLPGPGSEIPTGKNCALPKLEYGMDGSQLVVRAATIQSEFEKQFIGRP
jgi:uncharacterized membrane protein